MSLKEKIEEKAEELGWTIQFNTQRHNEKEEKYVEFRQYSPAGEDFGFCVFYENPEEIPSKVMTCFLDFDLDEHIEEWLEAKKNGVAGVPSARVLAKDAEDIEEMLKRLSLALKDILDK